jgi:hypothetical protein
MPCQTVSSCQFAGTTNIPYSFDVGIISVLMWQANTSVVANQFMRPSNGNETGYIYQNGATAGQTGPIEPAWAVPAGSVVPDASLNWTAVVPPATGQDVIASVTWTQLSPPDGTLSITGITHTPLTTSAFVSGGTKGSAYTILVESTMVSGAVYPIELVVTID